MSHVASPPICTRLSNMHLLTACMSTYSCLHLFWFRLCSRLHYRFCILAASLPPADFELLLLFPTFASLPPAAFGFAAFFGFAPPVAPFFCIRNFASFAADSLAA